MEEKWTTHIKAQTGLFEIDFNEIKKYKDLIFLFIKRNYTTRYKQTVLGPLWLVISPLVTVLLHSFVFGSIAGLSTDGSPQLLFYMTSNTIWSYFALCLTQTASTFTGNAGLFGKVYFPRITLPISTVLIGLLDLMIQLIMLGLLMVIYVVRGFTFHINIWLLAVPLLILQVALFGLGCGIIISSLTTKYRDLIVLAGFGMQLWMYVSPTVYTLSMVPEAFKKLYLLNPMASIISIWRYAFLGVGELPLNAWGVSWIFTIFILGVGLLLFNKVEKTFMDTV